MSNLEWLLKGILKETNNLDRLTKEYSEITKGNLNPQLCRDGCEMCNGTGVVAEFERDETGEFHEIKEVTCPNLLQEWDNTPDNEN